jgi:hypothetical protein
LREQHKEGEAAISGDDVKRLSDILANRGGGASLDEV